MIALIKGVLLNGISMIEGADKKPINMMVLEDDGSARDITGDAVAVDIHPKTGRGASPLVSFTGSIVVPTAGTFTITPTDTETDTLDAGTYYYWVKHTEAGGNIYMSGPGLLTVK